MQGTNFNEKDCMSLEGFCASIRLDIQHMMPDAVVTVEEVTKTNDVKFHSLIIMEKGDRLSPNIYMESFYHMYRSGMPFGEVKKLILAAYREERTDKGIDTKIFVDWKKAKKIVIFKLVNFGLNKEYLKDSPHFRFLDLAVTFELFLGSGAFGIATVHIDNHLMNLWGVKVKDLYGAALFNMPQLLKPIVQDINETIHELLGEENADLMLGRVHMDSFLYVLSNRQNINGAAYLLFDGVLQEFSKLVGGDFYILPSSVHEVLLLPASEINLEDEGFLNDMINQVNHNHVPLNQVLSDHYYKYDGAAQKVVQGRGKTHE